MAVGETGYGHPYCEQGSTTCTELNQYVNGYTGHDEPSLLFYSNTPGSGNNATYTMTLPTDPPALPRQDGSGGTFHFQPNPPFWFCLANCRAQSPPNPAGNSFRPPVPGAPNKHHHSYHNP